MRQYTEEELRREFEKTIIPPRDRSRHPHVTDEYVSLLVTYEWRGFIKCARFLGVLAEAKEVNNAPK